MKDFIKALLAIAGVTVVAGLTYTMCRSRRRETIPESAVRHKDVLTMADIVSYFKGLNLDQTKDTPFVSKDLGQFKVKATPAPNENVLLVGVYREATNTLTNYVVVYSRKYDEALVSLLSHAKDGVVTLS